MSEFDDLQAEFLGETEASGPAPEVDDIFDFAQRCLQQCLIAPSAASLRQLPTVITIYNAALKVLEEHGKDRSLATYILNNLALAYTHLPGPDRKANLQKAIEILEQLTALQKMHGSLDERAMAQTNLGVAYMDLAAYEEAAAEKALASLRSALNLYEEIRSPKYCARVHLNLALVYSHFGELSRESRFNLIIDHCNQAAGVLEMETAPIEWARLQAVRGDAMLHFGGGSDEEIRSTIASYRNALRVYNEWDFPSDWTTVQTGLAVAYRALKSGNRSENLDDAIRAYEAALRGVSQPNSPERWASLKCDMAATWVELADGHATPHLLQAIRAYEEARACYPARDFPEQRVAVQDSLAHCYVSMGGTEGGRYCQKAIEAWEELTRIEGRTGTSVRWATVQMNLGYAHARLAQITETKSNLIRALDHFRAAQEVFRACEYPREHGTLQEFVSLALGQLRDLGYST